MFIINRKGEREDIKFDKITDRISLLGKGLSIDFAKITQRVTSGIYSGITTAELDELAAETAAALVTEHYDYSILAAQIAIDNLNRNTPKTYSHAINILRFYDWNAPDFNSTNWNAPDFNSSECNLDLMNREPPAKSLINDKVYRVVYENWPRLNRVVDDAILNFNYFGFKTLESKYLLKVADRIVERVTYRYMTVSLAIHHNDIDMAIKNFHWMIKGKLSHATPTLMYAGTPRSENFASCFLVAAKEDSIDGIFKTMHNCAMISKYAGGIGLNIHNIRATGSYISGTNGTSDGVVPMLRVFNNIARYVNQGGGKRQGSIAVYLEPWHADIFRFLELRKEIAKEEAQAKDLFYALWMPDLFMKRVEMDAEWTLMCPNECPGLFDIYGDDFETLYLEYESKKMGRKTIKARELWNAIITTQIETGTPYICYKDACNRKSNQKNLGTIRSSNLCMDGNTMLLTKEYGWQPIVNLENKYAYIWNGYEWSNSLIMKTSEKAKLLEIRLNDGTVFKCTSDHKCIVAGGEKIAASSIKSNMRLVNEYYLPIANTPCIIDSHVLTTVKEKIEWLSDLLYNRGRYIIYDTNQKITEIKLLSQTIGINPLYIEDNALFALEYSDDDMISIRELKTALDKGEILPNILPNNLILTVTSVTELPGFYPTWCFGEPLRNQGLVNGFITGNCAEIVEFSNSQEVATCNLASIPLPSFVKYASATTTLNTTNSDINSNLTNDTINSKHGESQVPYFDYAEMMSATRQAVINLNRIIDINQYPISEARISNLRHRPLGIGVQGLADVFINMRYPFESQQARELNKRIFEALYYAALDQSCLIAETEGTYETYEGSPASQGQLQFDLWGVSQPTQWNTDINWVTLKERIARHGLRNSLLTALMPTASTAQILGNNESFEPYTSNIYKRKVLSGDFIVVNQYLVRDLQSLNMWNKETIDYIIANHGSIQSIPDIPESIKALYKTVWEIPQKIVIDYAADRGVFIDQSQSMNIYFEKPVTAERKGSSLYDRITAMHFYGWRKGLKTGMYYLRTTPATEALQFTLKPARTGGNDKLACKLVRNEQGQLIIDPECEACGS